MDRFQGSLSSTYFPNWCRADRGLCCDSSQEPAAEGTVKAPELQPCTERAGKGGGTPPHPGDTCAILAAAALISRMERWCLFLSAGVQEPGCITTPCSDWQDQLSLYWKVAAAESSPQVRSFLGWFLVSPGQAVGALLRDGQSPVKPLGIGAHLPVSDMCLYSPWMCLVHKICLGLCCLNCQMFLGETMPLKYGFYNQSSSFGSWRQLSAVLLLYPVLSDIPKHPTKRLSLQSWDSEYLQQCSAASISESINSSLQEESTLSIPICTSTLKNNFRKQMNHRRAIKRIK